MAEERKLQEGYDMIAKMKLNVKQMEHMHSKLAISNRTLRFMHNEHDPSDQVRLSKMMHTILKRTNNFNDNFPNEMLVIEELMKEEKFLDVLDELNVLLRREIDEIRKPKIEEYKGVMEIMELINKKHIVKDGIYE